MAATDDQTGNSYDRQHVYCYGFCGRNAHERANVGGVSIRSRNGAPSRKDTWSMVKELRQATNECTTSPPLLLRSFAP